MSQNTAGRAGQRPARTPVAMKSPLEQQGSIHGHGERVGAIRKIEPRLGMNALAVAVKSSGGGTHLCLVERNDFNLIVFQPLPKLPDSRDAVAAAQNTRGFMSIDRRQDATFVTVDDILEGCLFRFFEKNGDQG